MPTLHPPKGYKRGLSDEACQDMAERCMRSDLGQQALRQGWGRGLWTFVVDWGSTPSRPATIEALKRAANDLKWQLLDLRDVNNPDELTRANLSFLESAEAFETELKQRFLRSDNDDDRV